MEELFLFPTLEAKPNFQTDEDPTIIEINVPIGKINGKPELKCNFLPYFSTPALLMLNLTSRSLNTNYPVRIVVYWHIYSPINLIN